MRRFIPLSLVALVGLAALLAPTGLADSDPTETVPDIRGNWVFQADVGGGCTFDGTALLGTGAQGQLTCQLTARQVCNTAEEELAWTVRQSCTAAREGSELTITAVIETFLEGPPTPNYLPDNFSLTVQSASKMTGSLISFGTYDAVWMRETGFTS